LGGQHADVFVNVEDTGSQVSQAQSKGDEQEK
jgi:hypothetical protein